MEYPQGSSCPSLGATGNREEMESGSGAFPPTSRRSSGDESIGKTGTLRELSQQSDTEEGSDCDFASNDSYPVLRIEDLELPESAYSPLGPHSSFTSPRLGSFSQDTAAPLATALLDDCKGPSFAMTAVEWLAEKASAVSSLTAHSASLLPTASAEGLSSSPPASPFPASVRLLSNLSSADSPPLVPFRGAQLKQSLSPLPARAGNGLELSVPSPCLTSNSSSCRLQPAFAEPDSPPFPAYCPAPPSAHPPLFPPTSTEPCSDRLRTFVRIRPLQNEELQSEDILVVESATRIKVTDKVHESHGWTFDVDRVFGPQATQEDVWNNVATCVEKVIDGYNCTIFAHGQTGTGKTYTMLGPDMIEGCRGCELLSGEQSRDYAVFKQANAHRVQTIHRLIQHHTKIHQRFGADNENVQVFASYVQIYNEKLVDLLAPPNSHASSLVIVSDRHNPNSVVVQGLQLFEVKSTEELIHLLMEGTINRAFRATKQNDMSGRSHAIFQVEVRQTVNGETKTMKLSRLNLVDLAGNERCMRSRATEKMHVAEIGAINRSLSTLTLCIQQLAQGKSAVSYRSSNLTRLLQESLGGSCWTVFICTISPSALFVRETLSTLRLSVRAKTVKITAKLNELTRSPAGHKSLQREVAFAEVLARHQRQPPHQRSRGGQDGSEQSRGRKVGPKKIGPATWRMKSCNCGARGDAMSQPTQYDSFARCGSHATESRTSSNFCFVAVNQVSASAVQHPFRREILGTGEMQDGRLIPNLRLSTQKVEFSALAVLESPSLPQRLDRVPNSSNVEASVFSHVSDDSLKARNIRTAVRFLRKGLQRSISCPDHTDGTSLTEPTPRCAPQANLSHHACRLPGPVQSCSSAGQNDAFHTGVERNKKDDTLEKTCRGRGEERRSSSGFQGELADRHRIPCERRDRPGESVDLSSDVSEEWSSPQSRREPSDPHSSTSRAHALESANHLSSSDSRSSSLSADKIQRIHQKVQDRRTLQALLKGQAEQMHPHACSTLSEGSAAPGVCSTLDSASTEAGSEAARDGTGTHAGDKGPEYDTEHQQVQEALQILRCWLERKHRATESRKEEHVRECLHDGQREAATREGQNRGEGFARDSDKELQTRTGAATQGSLATSSLRTAPVSAKHESLPSALCSKKRLEGHVDIDEETAEYQTEAGDESSEASGELHEDRECSEYDCEPSASPPYSAVMHGGQNQNDVHAANHLACIHPRSVTSSLLPTRHNARYYREAGSVEFRVSGRDPGDWHGKHHEVRANPDRCEHERREAQGHPGYSGGPSYGERSAQPYLFQAPSLVSGAPFSEPVTAGTCGGPVKIWPFDHSCASTPLSFNGECAPRASARSECAQPAADRQAFSPDEQRRQHNEPEEVNQYPYALAPTPHPAFEHQTQRNTLVDKQSTEQLWQGTLGNVEVQTTTTYLPPTSHQSHDFMASARPSLVAEQAGHNESAVSRSVESYPIPLRDRQTKMVSSSPGLQTKFYAQAQTRECPNPDRHEIYSNITTVPPETAGCFLHSAARQSLPSFPPQYTLGRSRVVGAGSPSFRGLPGDSQTPRHVPQSQGFLHTQSSAGSRMDGLGSCDRLSMPSSPVVEDPSSFRQTDGSLPLPSAGGPVYFSASAGPTRSSETAQTRQLRHLHSSVPSTGLHATRGGYEDMFIPSLPPQRDSATAQPQHLLLRSQQQLSCHSYSRGQYFSMAQPSKHLSASVGSETRSQLGPGIILPTPQFHRAGIEQGHGTSADKGIDCRYRLPPLPPQTPHNQALSVEQRVHLPTSFEAAAYTFCQPSVYRGQRSTTLLPQATTEVSVASTLSPLPRMARPPFSHFPPSPSGSEMCQERGPTQCSGYQIQFARGMQQRRPPNGSDPGVPALGGAGCAPKFTDVSNPPVGPSAYNLSAESLQSTAISAPASPLQASRLYGYTVLTDDRRRVAVSQSQSHSRPLRDICYLSSPVRARPD
ncbi:putative kinesin motor domain-containing protein [Neospora caninum Liverpool]|uniref:Putative kinesin motor domain-containing protein n=1 Tax=Neospora caninum (strain Liverpool) TaxID=572307 RepID=F0VM74_NEOCL|nr:putative kinesin motor domain-containing protein [Neospora caninum Liverpool]CBZ54352.1 putative kinesin motor domain-containing protein [Neospora caninum Liverpool]|eukprot:XP_003884383.1 putative kinesin motor domain-containing protein [Neospora caninum Liverpool]